MARRTNPFPCVFVRGTAPPFPRDRRLSAPPPLLRGRVIPQIRLRQCIVTPVLRRRNVPSSPLSPPTPGEATLTHPWKTLSSPSNSRRCNTPPSQGDRHEERHLSHRVASGGLEPPLHWSFSRHLTYFAPIAIAVPRGWRRLSVPTSKPRPYGPISLWGHETGVWPYFSPSNSFATPIPTK